MYRFSHNVFPSPLTELIVKFRSAHKVKGAGWFRIQTLAWKVSGQLVGDYRCILTFVYFEFFSLLSSYMS